MPKMTTHTVVRPAKHLYEDDVMLLIFVENKFRTNGRTDDMNFVEKMAVKQWRFWSSFETTEGRYLMFIKQLTVRKERSTDVEVQTT